MSYALRSALDKTRRLLVLVIGLAKDASNKDVNTPPSIHGLLAREKDETRSHPSPILSDGVFNASITSKKSEPWNSTQFSVFFEKSRVFAFCGRPFLVRATTI